MGESLLLITIITLIVLTIRRTRPVVLGTGDIPGRYFEVRDPKVFAREADCYLLAATSRGGMLYFQAANPKLSEHGPEAHLTTLGEFYESILKQHPHTEPADEQGAQNWMLSSQKLPVVENRRESVMT